MRLMVIIDPKIFRVILGPIVGGVPDNPPPSHLPMANQVRYVIPYTHVKSGDRLPLHLLVYPVYSG